MSNDLKNKLADFCGNWLLQNDFEHTLCETKVVDVGRRITPRIQNYADVLAMKFLKSNRIGKLVSISGTVPTLSRTKCI